MIAAARSASQAVCSQPTGYTGPWRMAEAAGLALQANCKPRGYRDQGQLIKIQRAQKAKTIKATCGHDPKGEGSYRSSDQASKATESSHDRGNLIKIQPLKISRPLDQDTKALGRPADRGRLLKTQRLKGSRTSGQDTQAPEASEDQGHAGKTERLKRSRSIDQGAKSPEG